MRLFSFTVGLAAVLLLPAVARQGQVTYEVYAIRFGTLPQFSVSGLVAGADKTRQMTSM